MYAVMNRLLANEGFRRAMGAGAETRDLPPSLVDYEPSKEATRFFLDVRPAETAANMLPRPNSIAIECLLLAAEKELLMLIGADLPADLGHTLIL
eukprot:gene12527-15743_t